MTANKSTSNRPATIAALLLMLLVSISSASASIEIGNVIFNPDVDAHEADLDFYIKNTGTTTETGLVEMAFFPATLSIISSQSACNPDFPYNVHKSYSLAPGERTYVTLQSRNIPDGKYRAVLTHSTRCCTDGVNTYSCSPKQPYGFESTLATVTFGSAASNADDECDTDFQAWTFLKNDGDFSCAKPVCVDPTSPYSKARCALRGECNTGAVQSQNCPAGGVIDVRTCVNAVWKETGAVCYSGGVAAALPEKPTSDDSGVPLGGIVPLAIGISIIGAGVWYWRKK